MKNIENKDPREPERPEPEKEFPVRNVCGWCGKDMGESGFYKKTEGCVTHVICSECSKEQKGRIKQSK